MYIDLYVFWLSGLVFPVSCLLFWVSVLVFWVLGSYFGCLGLGVWTPHIITNLTKSEYFSVLEALPRTANAIHCVGPAALCTSPHVAVWNNLVGGHP